MYGGGLAGGKINILELTLRDTENAQRFLILTSVQLEIPPCASVLKEKIAKCVNVGKARIYSCVKVFLSKMYVCPAKFIYYLYSYNIQSL